MIAAAVKSTAPETVAYVHMRGTYDKIPDAMSRLFRWVKRHELTPTGMPETVYLTAPDVSDPTDAEWEIRAPIAEHKDIPPDATGIGVKHVASQLVASAMHKGPYETLGSTYEHLSNWVAENDYCVVGPCEEVYYSDPAEVSPEQYLTEVRFPVAAA